MENLTSHYRLIDKSFEKSEEGFLLPKPDEYSDRIIKACRYGLYVIVLFALAGILFFATKG
jgi:hypothetical protein